MCNDNTEIEVEKIFNYWVGSAEKDFQTMVHLYESNDYHWSLFIGHLVVEKLLKAYFVNVRKKHAPFVHDLLRLAESATLQVDEEKADLLDTITTFNLSARYDSYQEEFYKKCTKEFTAVWIDKIKELRTWIKSML